VAIAVIVWSNFDWWAYIDDDPPIPKFELPLWVQLPVSGLIGAICSATLLMVVRVCVGWTVAEACSVAEQFDEKMVSGRD